MNVPSLVNSPAAGLGENNPLPALHGNAHGMARNAWPAPFTRGHAEFKDSSHADQYLYERWGKCWVPTFALGRRFQEQSNVRTPVVEVPCPPRTDHLAHAQKQRPHHPPHTQAAETAKPAATAAPGPTTTTNDGLCEEIRLVGSNDGVYVPFRVVKTRVPCIDAESRGGVYGKFVRFPNACFVRADAQEPEPGKPEAPLGTLVQVPCSLLPPLPGLREEAQRLSAEQQGAAIARWNRALPQSETGESDSARPASPEPQSAPWRCVIL